jgi:hypothetical protein
LKTFSASRLSFQVGSSRVGHPFGRVTAGSSLPREARRLGMTTVLGISLLMLSVCSGYAQDRPCNESEAQQAEIEAATFRTWDALYKSYKLHRHCDDGAIAEGYSESVARILVDHWKTLPQLAHLARNDQKFRRFVLRHVDGTLNMDDVKKISANAKTRCPVGLRVLCDDLRKEADAP